METDFKPFVILLLVLLGASLVIGGSYVGAHETPSAPKKKPAEAIRGVWLTNVASDALYSQENIKKAVEKSASMGFNTIFVVTYNGGYTTYPSTVMKNFTGTTIDPDFKGRDPLKELIDEAHKHEIKVFAWFEFGFASSHKDATGGSIIQKNPNWASRDVDGKITEKNDFQWLNPFHPEVQQYITSLIFEVVDNYEVDGIQGDDRLPALPSNGGYSDYTVNLYKSENGGQSPPTYAKDYGWVKWRSDKLTSFLKQLVDSLRHSKPSLIISMAPSIYPWSEENYLQNWPKWLEMGLVDLMIPQVYRYNIEAYKHEMDKIYQEQVSSNNHFRVYPGVLLQVDDYNPTEAFLHEMIDYNRSKGTDGEVYFFYEGIHAFEKFFKSKYADGAIFPSNLRQTNTLK
jgi:uncharacterized lipoprotein YddW (UPF0748 family)